MKGAELTVYKHVGHFHNDETVDGLCEFIANRNVTMVESEPLEMKHKRFKLFCLRIKRADLTKLEDVEFWPEGVIFSSFFRSRAEDRRGANAQINDDAGKGYHLYFFSQYQWICW